MSRQPVCMSDQCFKPIKFATTMGIGHRVNFKKKTFLATKGKPTKKAKKKEKPKHLNRKLGSADNEDERSRILLEIQELEASKKQKESSPDKHSERSSQDVASIPAEYEVVMSASIDVPEVANKQLLNNEQAIEPKEENNATQMKNASQDDGDKNPHSLERQRGKRRRGRQDTSCLVEQAKQEDPKLGNKKEVDEAPIIKAKRYCIGRKPVTDFEIGKTYPGKIIYSKPYGIFIDIGCHSDAFCHVSRLSDDFVEDVENWRAEQGDTVEAARVVEIDRIRKRITVSLQSEVRVEDEMLSVKARKERRQKFHQKMNGKLESSRQQGGSAVEPIGFCAVEQMTEQPDLVQDWNQLSNGPDTEPDASIPAIDAKAKAADEKRRRKIARRAARRASKDTEENNS